MRGGSVWPIVRVSILATALIVTLGPPASVGAVSTPHAHAPAGGREPARVPHTGFASVVNRGPADPAAGAFDATVVPFRTTFREQVAPGVVRREGTWTTTRGVQSVELFDVDPATDGIRLEGTRPSSGVSALQTVRLQAERLSGEGHRVIVAINGDVWRTDRTTWVQAPLGLAVPRGELLSGVRWPRSSGNPAERRSSRANGRA